LLPVLPHDRRGRLQVDANGTALVDIGALGGNSPADILGSRYRRHPYTTSKRASPASASCSLSVYRSLSDSLRGVISELEIWRAANLLLKRYGDKARTEGTARADALAEAGDREGAAVWRRITEAVAQLANKSPSGALTASSA
jgi:hypothetical protein